MVVYLSLLVVAEPRAAAMHRRRSCLVIGNISTLDDDDDERSIDQSFLLFPTQKMQLPSLSFGGVTKGRWHCVSRHPDVTNSKQ